VDVRVKPEKREVVKPIAWAEEAMKEGTIWWSSILSMIVRVDKNKEDLAMALLEA